MDLKPFFSQVKKLLHDTQALPSSQQSGEPLLPYGLVVYVCMTAVGLVFSTAYTVFLLTDLQRRLTSREKCFNLMTRMLIMEVVAHLSIRFSSLPIFKKSGLGMYYFNLCVDLVLAWNLRKCIFWFTDPLYYPHPELPDNHPSFVSYIKMFLFEAKVKFLIYLVYLFVWLFFLGYHLI